MIEDDSELNGKEIKNPEQAFDPNTNEPLVNMEFTDKGREAFARVTKRIAERGRDCETLAGVDPTARRRARAPRTSSSASRSRWTTRSSRWRRSTTRRIPRASTAPALDPEHRSIQDAQDLAENLRIGALPIDLKLISQTQVSATLGQQALDQGLTAAAAGLAATIIFLLIFYRVLGMVATVALLIYAALLFALIKLIPITLTLPGIAGMVLTLAVAADANIVMYERIKEEVERPVRARCHLGGLRQGAQDDHRRERRDDRRGLHPVHARDRGRARIRVHAGSRHARVALHGGARHVGDPRHAVAHEAAAAEERLGVRTSGEARLAVRLHGNRAGSSRCRA